MLLLGATASAVAQSWHRVYASQSMSTLINETYAFDLGDWLDGACRGVRPRNAEAAAYSLRCSFDGMRRHLNWEEAMLLPAVSTVVTPENMAFLVEQLA